MQESQTDPVPHEFLKDLQEATNLHTSILHASEVPEVQTMTYLGPKGSLPEALDAQTRPLREPHPPQAQSRCPSSPVVVGSTLK
jgi:hypothetical protein